MDPFELRFPRRSGVRVTRLGLGTGPLGGALVRVTDATVAVDVGINDFDTAPWYGGGFRGSRGA